MPTNRADLRCANMQYRRMLPSERTHAPTGKAKPMPKRREPQNLLRYLLAATDIACIALAILRTVHP